MPVQLNPACAHAGPVGRTARASLAPGTCRQRPARPGRATLHAPAARPQERQLGARQLGRPRERVVLARASTAGAASGPGDAARDTAREAQKALAGEPEYSAEFKRTRWVAFFAMFLGYACFYLTRNSLSFVSPYLLEDASLGLNKLAVGGLVSALPLTYAFSKFLSGVLGARTSPTTLLAGGLTATALVNISFGASSSYKLMIALWGLNGLLQGLGAPACARILTSWYSDRERGTFWGFWTASNNIGGFLAPIIAGTAAKNYGWRYGMFAPGAISVAASVLVLLFMRNSPEECGYPPVGAARPKKPAPPAGAAQPGGKAGAEEKPGLLRLLLDYCLRSPAVWLLAVSYFFVYVVRQGVTSWLVLYLKEKGVANAAVQVSGLELGGLAGSLSSGAISDALVRGNDGRRGNVGLRIQVVIAYTVALAAALGAFWVAPPVPWLQWLLVAGIGFTLYGPQMLIGLCGAEVVPKPAVSAAQGFLGWVSYLGAANAGVPLAHVVQRHGWSSYFATMGASCAIIVLLLAPLINRKSHSQAAAEADAKAA